MKAIIELMGPFGSGKTTLASLFAEEWGHAHMLFVDASGDQRLTQMLSPQPPSLSVAQLLNQHQEALSSNRESVDWAFHDLTVGIGEEMDLMTVGALPESIPAPALEILRYGLTRLLDTYTYVVVDGLQPVIHQCLNETYLHSVLILTPENAQNWQKESMSSVHTLPLILNQFGDEPLPSALDQALRAGDLQLVGKLPRYASSEARIRQLGDDFHNVLLRLNIPFNLASS